MYNIYIYIEREREREMVCTPRGTGSAISTRARCSYYYDYY